MIIQKSLFLVILITLINACSDSEPEAKVSCEGEINLDSQIFPQKWQLIKMTGNIANSETTGEQMAWQEYILLNADNSFVKNRTQNNQATEETGTYNFEIVGDDQSIQLNLLYNSENSLVGNCFGNPKLETYMLTTKCRLVGTWSWCDGPGLEYQKQ
jgi:hypothetical protein